MQDCLNVSNKPFISAGNPFLRGASFRTSKITHMALINYGGAVITSITVRSALYSDGTLLKSHQHPSSAPPPNTVPRFYFLTNSEEESSYPFPRT